MGELKIILEGLQNDREKMIFICGFYNGILSTEHLQGEMKELERQYFNAKGKIQRAISQGEESGNIY